MLMVNVVIGIVAKLLSGLLADSYGRKKVMVAAQGISLLAYAVMTACNSPWFSIPQLTYCMLLVHTFCFGMFGPANSAMLIDVTTKQERKQVFSYIFWANSMSFAVGSLLGGLLFHKYLFWLFLSLSFGALLVFVIIALFIEESYQIIEKNGVKEHVNWWTRYRELLSDRIFIGFVLACTFLTSLDFQLTNYIALRFERVVDQQSFFGAEIDGTGIVGVLLSENTLIVVLSTLVVSRYFSKFKDKHVMLVGVLLVTLGFTVLSYTTNLTLLLLIMAIISLGEILIVPIRRSYMASIPPAHARSTYMAFHTLHFNGAQLIAYLFLLMSSILPSEVITIFILFLRQVCLAFFYLNRLSLKLKKVHLLLFIR
ncbi:DHA1 family multidrug resistance protein B-like MFS transporter [Salirhabdus euzebyi]|uniref:DHA1 family multidrug resistance protein B-like MFS transporter n=1 Tax=Salirhabdus euzebyi TaxID=394506 RepID=A0A841Q5Z1_9BACI|nr:DHA1 family multidrug resistance protein B-like MFS transporter [Salirhabdus euzebyi]